MITFFIILILFLIAAVIALFIGTKNLTLQVEQYEDLVSHQNQFIQRFSRTVEQSQKRLDEIDEKGSFVSDDEVGYFFTQLKEIQADLNAYTVPQNYGKEEERQ